MVIVCENYIKFVEYWNVGTMGFEKESFLIKFKIDFIRNPIFQNSIIPLFQGLNSFIKV